jgi:hypothetical protein
MNALASTNAAELGIQVVLRTSRRMPVFINNRQVDLIIKELGGADDQRLNITLCFISVYHRFKSLQPLVS